MRVRSSSVSLPHQFLTCPLACFHFPANTSAVMSDSPLGRRPTSMGAAPVPATVACRRSPPSRAHAREPRGDRRHARGGHWCSQRERVAGCSHLGGDSARGVALVMGLALGRSLGLIEIVDYPLIAELHGPADRLLVAPFARTSRPPVHRLRHASLRLVVFRPALAGLVRRPGFRSTVGGLLHPPAIPLPLIRMPLIRLWRH